VRVDEVGAVRLGDHGNVATWAEAVIDGLAVLVVSVQLDSDDPDRRRTERPALLELTAGHERVVMAGDYNEDTITTDLGGPFFGAGFVDVAEVCDAREPTHPVARDADDWKALAIIDHVLVRGIAPIAAAVHDAGTWELSEWDDRTEALLRRTGSDHLLVAATLDL
jgi:endonuclease/exonuclease/phosphatase family metal-dependent hydrolase